MPFTAHDLRYQAEESYPLLYAYLHRNAQRFLGALKYDAFEVDTVIGHVIEQLVRLGLLGASDTTSVSALDRLTDAQFYAFLSRMVKNKAIDRLRKRRLQVSSIAELEELDESDSDFNPLNEAVVPAWGGTPFSTPEEITLQIASQRDLRNVLKHCILLLSAAPNQLQAVVQELQEMGCDDLLSGILAELQLTLPLEPHLHMSQHKDHAHKKLRMCLQQRSSNLIVMIALRLTVYSGKQSVTDKDYRVDLLSLRQDDLSPDDVRTGLQGLVTEGYIDWHGEDEVSLTPTQLKRLSRVYKED